VFNVEAAVTPSQEAHKIRFGHHLTTDGVSASVCTLRIGNADIERQKKGKGRKKKRLGKDELLKQQDEMAREVHRRHHDALRSGDLDLENVVGGDPGKHILLQLTNGRCWTNLPKEEREAAKAAQKNIRYTAKQRQQESRAKVREQRTPKPQWVLELEAQLSSVDSRATSVKGFAEYLSVRFRVQTKLRAFYRKVIHRVNRWHTWRDRRSSEDRFVARAVKVFGHGAIIAYGTWSEHGHSMRGLAPTPTVALRRRFAMKLAVYDTPEWYTTISCSRCLEQVKPDPARTYLREVVSKEGKKKHISTPLRSIRRCNSDQCGGLRWVRDQNAPINIRSNLIYAMLHGIWNYRFSATKFLDRRSQNPPLVQEEHPQILWHEINRIRSKPDESRV